VTAPGWSDEELVAFAEVRSVVVTCADAVPCAPIDPWNAITPQASANMASLRGDDAPSDRPGAAGARRDRIALRGGHAITPPH
jgi:hypothetical protein